MKKFIPLLILLFGILGTTYSQPSEQYSEDFSGISNNTPLPYYDDDYSAPDTVAIWRADTTNAYTWKYGTQGLAGNTSEKAYIDNQAEDSVQKETFDVTIHALPQFNLQPEKIALRFKWYSQMPENNGGGTDPITDPDADLTIQMRYYSGGNAGTWSTIWKEDSLELLEETTSGKSLYNNYTFDYDQYVNGNQDDWFPAEVEITDTYSNPDSIQVRFRYEGQNGGNVGIDDLRLTYSQTDAFEAKYRILPDYYYKIPESQTQRIDFKFHLTNHGVDSFDVSNVKLNKDGNTYGYAEVPKNDLDSAQSKTYTIANYTEKFEPEGNYQFEYDASIPYYIGGNAYTWNWTSGFEMRSTPETYTRYNGIWNGTISAGNENNAFGTLFEMVKKDHFAGAGFEFNSNGASFKYQLVDMSSDTSVSEVIYESGSMTTSTFGTVRDDLPVSEQIVLEEGLYMIRVIQTSADNIQLPYDNNEESYYYTGTSDQLTKVSGEGNLAIKMYVQENRTPDYAVDTKYEHTLSTDQKYTYTLQLDDADNDPVGYRRIDPDQQWLKADWLNIEQRTDTTITFIGETSNTGSYEFDVRIGDAEGDSTTETFTFEVIEPYKTDFKENYVASPSDHAGWTTIDDSLDKGSTLHWELNHTEQNAGDEFKSDEQVASIEGEAGVEQEEWLISPAVELPSLSADADSALHLEFAWRMAWKYFTGPGLGNDNDGYDAGDLTVMISQNGGDTWNKLWKEDDSTDVLSTTVINENGTTDDDEYYDDTPLNPEGWPGYEEGRYNTGKDYYADDYYLSRINLNSYAGQKVWIAFKYESESSQVAGSADFYLDYMELNAIKPGIELQAMPLNTTGYTKIPVTQAQPVTIKADVTNRKLKDLKDANITATYVNPSGGTAFNQTKKSDVEGQDTTSAEFGTFTPEKSGNYDFTVDVEYREEGTPYSTSETNDNIFEITSAVNGVYARDNGSKGRTSFKPEEGDFTGTKFDIHEPDNLRKIRLFIDDYTQGDEISFTLVKKGDVVLNSPKYTAGNDFDSNWQTFDLKDTELGTGTYYLMVKTEETSGKLEFAFDNNPKGHYYEGAPGNIKMNEGSAEEDTPGNMLLRMVLGNNAPVFDPEIEDQQATAGKNFSYNISALDENGDSLTFIMEQAPDWLNMTNKDDGNRAVISGLPGSNNEGSNLVKVGVFDAHDTTRTSFSIEVGPNPAPEFTTTPVIEADAGSPYEYMAAGSDRLGDDVTLNMAEGPDWLSASSATNDSLQLSGTPTSNDVGEQHVKINITDEYGKTAQQAFTIMVRANAKPEFTTSAPLEAREGEMYTYDVAAKDENSNDQLSLSADAPDWLNLTDHGNGSGKLEGTPSSGDTGANKITLTVTDNKGASAEQNFTIQVEAANNTPAFADKPKDTMTVQAGTLFEYQVNVEDPDNDQISFNANIPDWILITNEGEGVADLRGEPMLEELGIHEVNITATDGKEEISQQFVVSVIDTTSEPKMDKSQLNNAYINSNYEASIEATDEDGDKLSFEAKEIPQWLTLEDKGNGTAVLKGTPSKEDRGEDTLRIDVSDGLHNENFDLSLEVIAEATGMDKDISSDKLTMYPNPAKDQVTFENVAEARIVIFNTLGSKVLEKDNLNDTQRINISSFEPGNYLVKIIKENNSYTRLLMVK
jgi:hypothetical protein